MAEGVLKHHADMYQNWKVAGGLDYNLRTHLLYLQQCVDQDGQLVYPELQTEEGIREYIMIVTQQYNALRRDELTIMSDSQSNVDMDGRCRICSHNVRGRCNRSVSC